MPGPFPTPNPTQQPQRERTPHLPPDPANPIIVPREQPWPNAPGPNPGGLFLGKRS